MKIKLIKTMGHLGDTKITAITRGIRTTAVRMRRMPKAEYTPGSGAARGLMEDT
jgi:hypothetical protein